MLKLELYRYKKLVFGQVLAVPGLWLKEEKKVAVKDFDINLDDTPGVKLGTDSLSIGNSYKEETLVCECSDYAEAITLCQNIKACITKLNGEAVNDGSVVREI